MRSARQDIVHHHIPRTRDARAPLDPTLTGPAMRPTPSRAPAQAKALPETGHAFSRTPIVTALLRAEAGRMAPPADGLVLQPTWDDIVAQVNQETGDRANLLQPHHGALGDQGILALSAAVRAGTSLDRLLLVAGAPGLTPAEMIALADLTGGGHNGAFLQHLGLNHGVGIPRMVALAAAVPTLDAATVVLFSGLQDPLHDVAFLTILGNAIGGPRTAARMATLAAAVPALSAQAVTILSGLAGPHHGDAFLAALGGHVAGGDNVNQAAYLAQRRPLLTAQQVHDFLGLLAHHRDMAFIEDLAQYAGPNLARMLVVAQVPGLTVNQVVGLSALNAAGHNPAFLTALGQAVNAQTTVARLVTLAAAEPVLPAQDVIALVRIGHADLAFQQALVAGITVRADCPRMARLALAVPALAAADVISLADTTRGDADIQALGAAVGPALTAAWLAQVAPVQGLSAREVIAFARLPQQNVALIQALVGAAAGNDRILRRLLELAGAHVATPQADLVQVAPLLNDHTSQEVGVLLQSGQPLADLVALATAVPNLPAADTVAFVQNLALPTPYRATLARGMLSYGLQRAALIAAAGPAHNADDVVREVRLQTHAPGDAGAFHKELTGGVTAGLVKIVDAARDRTHSKPHRVGMTLLQTLRLAVLPLEATLKHLMGLFMPLAQIKHRTALLGNWLGGFAAFHETVRNLATLGGWVTLTCALLSLIPPIAPLMLGILGFAGPITLGLNSLQVVTSIIMKVAVKRMIAQIAGVDPIRANRRTQLDALNKQINVDIATGLVGVAMGGTGAALKSLMVTGGTMTAQGVTAVGFGMGLGGPSAREATGTTGVVLQRAPDGSGIDKEDPTTLLARLSPLETALQQGLAAMDATSHEDMTGTRSLQDTSARVDGDLRGSDWASVRQGVDHMEEEAGRADGGSLKDTPKGKGATKEKEQDGRGTDTELDRDLAQYTERSPESLSPQEVAAAPKKAEALRKKHGKKGLLSRIGGWFASLGKKVLTKAAGGLAKVKSVLRSMVAKATGLDAMMGSGHDALGGAREALTEHEALLQQEQEALAAAREVDIAAKIRTYAKKD